MTLPIEIDKHNGIPMYIQLGERIWLLTHQGVLRVGDTMPTVRELAVDLGVNANTVSRVYCDLQNEGWLQLRWGVGTFVAEGTDKPVSRPTFQKIEKRAGELNRLAGMSCLELS